MRGIPTKFSNCSEDLFLGQRPAREFKTGNEAELQFLVDNKCLAIISDHIGCKGERKLCWTTSRVPPFEAARRMVIQVVSRVELSAYIAVFGGDAYALFGSGASINFHTTCFLIPSA
jgi:hypothetical protein